MTPQVSANWYQHFFGPEWLDLASHLTTAEQTETEVEFILEATALKPGGRFFRDTISHAWLMRYFEPRGRHPLDDGSIPLHCREFDFSNSRNNVTWIRLYPDGSHDVLSHSLRVYALAEFKAMLATPGLALRQVVISYGRERKTTIHDDHLAANHGSPLRA
jgi:hypothetical protein